MSTLGKAIRIASVAFEGKTDKGGHPYILHCLHVMNEVASLGEEAMIIAVLHDLIEDTDWTKEHLLSEGFSLQVVQMILNLTRATDEEYMTYIKRASMNNVSRMIKMADLRHNSDIMRMKGLRKKDFERLEKYHMAYAYLSE